MRVCKGCMIRELDFKAEYESMFEYINRLDERIKVNHQIYEVRLQTCRCCDSLINGMCKHCGCFVEMRAAITRNYCPNKKW